MVLRYNTEIILVFNLSLTVAGGEGSSRTTCGWQLLSF